MKHVVKGTRYNSPNHAVYEVLVTVEGNSHTVYLLTEKDKLNIVNSAAGDQDKYRLFPFLAVGGEISDHFYDPTYRWYYDPVLAGKAFVERVSNEDAVLQGSLNGYDLKQIEEFLQQF